MRTHLTYANVMATIAVFIALGGSSFAAVTLSRNSVRSTHIKNGEVKRADLARNAVDSTKVRNGALLAQDFRAGQLPAGPAGPTGPLGPKGDKGDRGSSGATNVVIRSASHSVAPTSTGGAVVYCNDGEVATGGGGNLGLGEANQDATIWSQPEPSTASVPRGWQFRAFNSTASQRTAKVFVICASP